MCNISRDIIRYFSAVATEDPVLEGICTIITMFFSLYYNLMAIYESNFNSILIEIYKTP